MKKRLLTVLLAVCLVVALGTVTAAAADDALPAPTDGVITLTEDYNLGTSRVEISENVSVIDLNGHKITGLLNVTHQLTIRDTSAEADGVIVAPNGEDTLISTIYVLAGGNLTIESGTIQAAGSEGRGAIRNMGTLTINGGTVTGAYGIRSGAQLDGNAIYTKVSLTINDGIVHGDEYAIYTYGRGITNGDVTTADNKQVTLNINGGRVESNKGIAIGTNASRGAYAGYTLNMTDGEVEGGITAMYLPAIGINNISGGTITGEQAIRIASGVLNITDGTLISDGNSVEDIIAAKPGGASGALVIGKAGTGYVGDLIVNVSGEARLVNSTTGENQTALYVTDKTMDNSSYDDVVIEVNIDGIEIDGDVLRTSGDSETNAKSDTTTLTIDSAIVTGDVINQSKNGGVTVNSSIVTGSVTVAEDTNGTVAVFDSNIGSKSNTGVILVNTAVGERDPITDTGNYVAVINGVGYTTLEAAIEEASSGDTITLVDDVAAEAGVTIPNDKALTIVGNGHSIEINHDNTSAEHDKALILYSPLTLDGVELTINGYNHNGDGIQVGADTSDDATLTITNNSKVTLNDVSNAMVMPGGANAEVTVENSEFTLNGIGGNGSNGGTYVFNNADVNVNGCASYGFSVYSMETSGNTTIDISNTGLSAIYGHSTLNFGGNTVVNVDNCGPKEVGSGGDDWGFRDAPIQLRRGPAGAESITIGENATVNITNCTDQNGNSINNIYVVAGTTYTNNGTVNANIVMEAAPTGWNTVKVINNGVTIYSGYVADNGSFKLPTLSRNGYTFGGWRVNNSSTVVKGGTSYTVTADTTFTAIWNAINIPDTYDIELIVGEGGEAKASYSNASAGTTITITVAPDEGYELDYITVDGERISGTTFKMPDHDVTVRVYFTDGSAVLPFTDVSANQWFYEAVSYVYTNGMMEGDSATTFNPDGRMTRAMFWAVLGRIDGATITGANWVETARSWAMAEGVSDGTNPNDYVTREMMVTMLWRYAGEPASEESLSAYTDAASVSDWAAEAMSWALETGVIEGVTATTLQPQGTATRAQCATIFMRYDMI